MSSHDDGHATTYEPKDIDLGPITIATLIIFAILVVILFLFYGIVQAMESYVTNSQTIVEEVEMETPLVPSPRLQPNPIDNHLPIEDMDALRNKEHQMLENYAEVNEELEIYRVPIDAAMEKMVEKGFPVRQE